MEYDTIVLENNIEYIIASTVRINETKYYLLINPLDKYEYLIRKEVDDELVGLDDKNEFEIVVSKLYIVNAKNPYLEAFIEERKRINSCKKNN